MRIIDTYIPALIAALASTQKNIINNIRGNALIEFALVGPIFLAILFAIFDIGLLFFTEESINIGFQSAVRRIRIGAHYGSREEFKNAICDNSILSLNCSNNMFVEAQVYNPSSPPVSKNIINSTSGAIVATEGSFDFNQGVAGDIVLVSVYYVRPQLMNTINLLTHGGSNMPYVIHLSAAFRNELF